MKLDNQQERQFFNIGFLVGMLEGEGCLTINKTVSPTKYLVYISITGKNKQLMEKVAEIASELNLPFHFRNYRQVCTIQVSGMSRCKKWLDLVYPYLIGKKPQADILLEFIALRDRVMSLHPYNKPYSQKEYDLKELLKRYNARQRIESSTTARHS